MRLDGFLALSTNDVTGESTDNRNLGMDGGGQAFTQRIEVISYSFRIFRDKALNDRDPQRPVSATHSVVTVVKYVDAATTKLAQLLYKNKRVAEMSLIVRGAFTTAGTPRTAVDSNLLTVRLKTVLVTRLRHVGNPGLHLLGPVGPGQNQRKSPIISGAALGSGPLEQVDLLCFQGMSWAYGNKAAVTWNDPQHGNNGN